MSVDLILLALAAWLLFGKRDGLRVVESPTGVIDKARYHARKQGIPETLLLATVLAESRGRHLRPTGSGQGRTFYPAGIQINRGRDILKRENPRLTDADLTDDYVASQLSDLDRNLELAAKELRRGWTAYQPDHMRMRVFWVAPGVAKSGPPYEGKWSGSVPWSRRLENWEKHTANALNIVNNTPLV